jgi:hypothetical protein
MLAARDDLYPALVALLVDAAHEIHSEAVFEEAGEFPDDSCRSLRLGRRRSAQAFWAELPLSDTALLIATKAERAIIILLPLAAVLFPLFHYLPQFLRWRARSRVYRWYGELALLERDVATRTDALPTEKWLADLDRIERSVSQIRTPAGFASEAYTLREHIGLVRRAVMARIAPNFDPLLPSRVK